MSRFAVRDLSVLAYANGFTLWHYKHCASTLAECQVEGFFNDAGDMMAVGDVVFVTGPEGGRHLVVRTSDHGLVRLAEMTR